MFEELKEAVRVHLKSKVPGMYQLLEFLASLNYGKSCLDLLFTSPSKVYLLVLQHYQGNATTADLIFRMLFINPITSHLRRPELEHRLLELAKLGNDTAFLELIRKAMIDRASDHT
uniref:DUF3227 domain-containing protein n=1 Tax=Ignisphaera aggregans TaxID=334771 RepID=A0A7C2ZPZ2_9CREN